MAVIKVKTVNHVGVPVKDRKRAFAFYRDLLGLEVIPSMVDNENIAWLQAADGTMVHIVGPTGVRMAAPHTAYEVDDFDQALKAVQEAGYHVDGPGERHGGQRYFFVLDPDGNRWNSLPQAATNRSTGLPTSGATRGPDKYLTGGWNQTAGNAPQW